MPGLRNVEKTWPYFHDGSVKSLGEAVRLMADCELGVELSPADTKTIVAWLMTLTGEIPNEHVRPPRLPASTARTPRPKPAD